MTDMTLADSFPTSRITTSELLRKIVHVSFGFVSLTLKWLPYPLALLMAVGAFIFNAFILPFVGGKKIARNARGNDIGIIVYPAAVFFAVLLFRGPNLFIAGAVWAILAFGDGFASVFGRVIRSTPLPWNEKKSLAGFVTFLLCGGSGAYLLARFLDAPPHLLSLPTIIIVATILSAIGETVELGIDDNIIVSLVAMSSLAWLSSWSRIPTLELSTTTLIWLGVNLALAVVGFMARSVNLSGMLGGLLLGAILILFGGWQLYAVLLIFFVIGSGTTKLGFRKKEKIGLAQEGGGRRGFSHAFANVGVAAICALSYALLPRGGVLWLIGAVASLATAAADTTASEVGQLLGKRPFLPLTFQRVDVGTEGAISIEGTLAGALAGSLTAVAGVFFLGGRMAIVHDHLGAIALTTAAAAVAGSYIESVVGSFNRRAGKPISNGALNFFNTLVGAAMGAVLAAAVLS